MLYMLTFLCLLVTLLTVSALPVPASPLLPFDTPITPTIPTASTFTHPLLATVNDATATAVNAADAIKPGQLNLFNLSRPEGARFFYLYVPSTYGQNKTGLPLAFFFHGYGGGWLQGVQLNLTDVAERMGWLLALPHGTPAMPEPHYVGWNAGSCCIFNETSIVDDVMFTRLAVRAVESAVLVDARRRYAMGWSNGAMMSERLACEASDEFSGVAADEGSVVLSFKGVEYSLQMCDDVFGSKRIDYLHFHGTADPTVPWTGTANFPYFASTLQDVSRWVRRQNCSGHVLQTFNDGTFSNLVWPDCRDGREVELMSVRNGVHQWWTPYWGGFNTAHYAFEWFDRTHRKHVAEEEQQRQQKASESKQRRTRMASA